MRILLAVLMAHSWYPQECCSDGDCKLVPCDELIIHEEGLVYKDTLFTKNKIKISEDAFCHICIGLRYPGVEDPRCVFVPNAIM